jgi:hypothetical protein
MNHSTSDLILHCIDFRFTNTLYSEGLYDELSYAGGCLCVLDDDTNTHKLDDILTENGEAYFKMHLKLSIKLHNIKNIHLVDHEDCGVYNSLYPDVKNEEDKFSIHKKNLLLAEDKLKNIIEDISTELNDVHILNIKKNIHLFYAKLDMSVINIKTGEIKIPKSYYYRICRILGYIKKNGRMCIKRFYWQSFRFFSQALGKEAPL